MGFKRERSDLIRDRVLVIAEAGVNHNGDIGLARELVKAAAEAGADLVKFQTFTADNLVSRNAAKAEYQKKTSGESETQFEMLRRLELTRDDHHRLMECCAEFGVGFFSTGFDLASVEFLDKLGFIRHKIPSGEITNYPYLRQIGGYGKEVILSTGMANLGEIEAALKVLQEAGTPREKIIVLHCTTEYPTPMAEVNLRAMCSIQEAFQVRVGYSDHTQGVEIPIAAVALGAVVIEKHFTLDRSLPGPDHQASLEPGEMAMMVQGIRNLELALGNGVKTPTPSEMKNREIARKSIVAKGIITKGNLFSLDNMDAKRPGNGMCPMMIPQLVGRHAGRDFMDGEQIEL